MFRLVMICALFALAAAVANAQPSPVKVDGGLLQGEVADGVTAYRGVPYAAPPVGPLRWRAPAPVQPWSGARPATAFGAICPQNRGMGVAPGATQSEDCLYLNVWAPAHPAGPAPVMVWIHGGGDDAGAASQAQFDGTPFANDGVVFVSVDYRLGALGWFAHPALTREAAPGAPLGDYGLMDIIAALQWVQRNIVGFGGDPRRVTLAGESAGGESVLFLMTTPAAKDLFSQAIVESGGGWYGYPTLAKAEVEGAALAEKAGAAENADAAALRALPVAALLAAQQYAGVIIDGRLVKSDVAAAFAGGDSAKVPLLIGSNNGEDSLLGRSDPKEVLKDYSADQLANLRTAYGPEAPDDDALGRAIFRDSFMGAPARWFAARQSARAPAFLYRFGYVPSELVGRRKTAGHGFEMLFVFKALSRAPIPLVADDADRAVMSAVHSSWTAFVQYGNPSPFEQKWPSYAPPGDVAVQFTSAIAIESFRPAAYDILDAIEAGRLANASAPR